MKDKKKGFPHIFIFYNTSIPMNDPFWYFLLDFTIFFFLLLIKNLPSFQFLIVPCWSCFSLATTFNGVSSWLTTSLRVVTSHYGNVNIARVETLKFFSFGQLDECFVRLRGNNVARNIGNLFHDTYVCTSGVYFERSSCCCLSSFLLLLSPTVLIHTYICIRA